MERKAGHALTDVMGTLVGEQRFVHGGIVLVHRIELVSSLSSMIRSRAATCRRHSFLAVEVGHDRWTPATACP